jgi:hypothetical protein
MERWRGWSVVGKKADLRKRFEVGWLVSRATRSGVAGLPLSGRASSCHGGGCGRGAGGLFLREWSVFDVDERMGLYALG